MRAAASGNIEELNMKAAWYEKQGSPEDVLVVG
jgi:hypothetical protein